MKWEGCGINFISFGTEKISNGKEWAVSGMIGDTPTVIIPIDSLDGLSNEEIGEQVRRLLLPARIFDAEQLAKEITPHPTFAFQLLDQLKDFNERSRPRFEELAPHSEIIRKCIAGWDEIQRYSDRRDSGVTKKLRYQFHKLSDKLFRKIHARDGRKCLSCGSTRKLTLDHIIPIVLGGSNEEDNLQLLCGPCNSKKGTHIKDFRVATVEA